MSDPTEEKWDQVLEIMNTMADMYDELNDIDRTSPDFEQGMALFRQRWLGMGIDLTQVPVLVATIHSIYTMQAGYHTVVEQCPITQMDPQGAMHGVAHLNGIAAEYFSAVRYFWEMYAEGPDFDVLEG
jgi:hypothetical protein